MILRMVVWRGYDDREAAAPVLREHGMTLDVTYVASDMEGLETLPGALAEIDVVAIDNRWLPLLLDAELLSPLDTSRLPNAVDTFEVFSRLARSSDGTTWSAPFIWGRQPVPYNAAFIAEPPLSRLDVLKREYRGNVAMLDVPYLQIITWGRVLGYPDPANITSIELEAAVELAIRVKREAHARLVGWDEVAELLASGEAWIATAGWEALSRFAAQQGADVRMSYPREGVFAWMDSCCIPRAAPNEAAAYAWIDWMIGPEAQAIVCGNLLCGPVNARSVELLDAKDALGQARAIDALYCAAVTGASVKLSECLDLDGNAVPLTCRSAVSSGHLISTVTSCMHHTSVGHG